MSSTAKSIPTAHSTPAHAQPSPAEELTKVSALKEVPILRDPVGVAPSRISFPLALTIVAVLPIALGFGAVRLKASSAPVREVVSKPSTTTEIQEKPLVGAFDRRIGDRDFIERRFEVALRYYNALGSDHPERLPAELQYRIALCQEALGLWDEALVAMRSVAETAESRILRAAASFGQARIWFRLNHADQAESLLRSLDLHSDANRQLPRNLDQDMAFLIPLALAQNTVTSSTRNSAYPVSQLLTWSLESALSWADEATIVESPDIDHELSQLPDSEETNKCRLHRPASDASSRFHIDEWTVDFACQRQSIEGVVKRIADECGWSIDWSNLRDEPALSQTVNLAMENRPVICLLTELCCELRATWSLNEDCLIFARSETDGVLTHRMIARTLESLVISRPNHRYAQQARFALAQLSQSRGDIQQAATLFAALVGRESSTLAIHAAYNAAYDYYRMGDFARACAQLSFVVDGAPEQSLHIEAVILLGRLLMDRGEVQEAVFQLRRATQSRCLPNQRARAAVLLGLAYLTQEKYEEAAEAVFTHKLLMDEPGLRYAASFVTAYSRWHSVSGPLKEREATFLYRSLVAVRNNSEWMGQSGQLLIGRAYLELGFDDMMTDLYSHLLNDGVTEHIEAEVTYALANHEMANERYAAAAQLWQKLADGPGNPWKSFSRLKLAEVALAEGRSNDALQQCQQIQPDALTTRAAILKTMGRAYEQLGDDIGAARCYAGQPPTP